MGPPEGRTLARCSRQAPPLPAHMLPQIYFIDADMLVTVPIDGVFDHAATDLQRTKAEPDAVKPDEASLPLTYLFAGKAEAFSDNH